jgi:hypothetical protein
MLRKTTGFPFLSTSFVPTTFNEPCFFTGCALITIQVNESKNAGLKTLISY